VKSALLEKLGQSVTLQLLGTRDGQELDGVVLDVRDDAVILDMNLGPVVVPFHAIAVVWP
jgi:hypothetical protein